MVLDIKYCLVVMLVGLMVAASGCGGSDASDTGSGLEARDSSEWVTTYCAVMNVYVTEIGLSVEDLDATGATLAAEDLEDHRENLLGYYERWAEANTDLLESLGDAGYPDMAGGEATALALISEFGKAGPAARDAQAGIEGLPGDDPVAFWDELRVIEDEFSAAARIQSRQTYPLELDELLSREPGCEGL